MQKIVLLIFLWQYELAHIHRKIDSEGEKRMKIHFICGIPRSGSTLLSTILSQNPRIHSTITSPVNGIVTAIRQTVSSPNEHYPLMSDALRNRLYVGVFQSYYQEAARSGRALIIDSNRSWPLLLPLVNTLFPQAKMIVCVRNLGWVIDSLERLFRRNATIIPSFFTDAMEARTVYTRTDALMRQDRIIGASWNATREGFYGELSERLLLLEYDYLVKYPQRAIATVYDFIDEPGFEHAFTGLTMDGQELIEQFDAALGVPGLHRVNSEVKWIPRQTILPPDLFSRLATLSFWHDVKNTKSTLLTDVTRHAST